MDKMRELKEELKKTNTGRKFLEEAEPRNHTNKLIEFAGEQCKIFPEDSEMGEYLRETMKMLQESPCEDAVSMEDVIKAIDRHTFDTDDGLCLNEDISIILEELPPVKPTQRWIPVSERLPEENGFYLATYDGEICGENEPFTCLTEYENGKWVDDEFVLAWMPLTEPYKAETESEV